MDFQDTRGTLCITREIRENAPQADIDRGFGSGAAIDRQARATGAVPEPTFTGKPGGHDHIALKAVESAA